MYIYTRETLQSCPRTSTYCPSLHRPPMVDPSVVNRPILKYFVTFFYKYFVTFLLIFLNIYKKNIRVIFLKYLKNFKIYFEIL